MHASRAFGEKKNCRIVTVHKIIIRHIDIIQAYAVI